MAVVNKTAVRERRKSLRVSEIILPLRWNNLIAKVARLLYGNHIFNLP